MPVPRTAGCEFAEAATAATIDVTDAPTETAAGIAHSFNTEVFSNVVLCLWMLMMATLPAVVYYHGTPVGSDGSEAVLYL